MAASADIPPSVIGRRQTLIPTDFMDENPTDVSYQGNTAHCPLLVEFIVM